MKIFAYHLNYEIREQTNYLDVKNVKDVMISYSFNAYTGNYDLLVMFRYRDREYGILSYESVFIPSNATIELLNDEDDY